MFLETMFGLECADTARIDGWTLIELFGDKNGVALAQLPVDQASFADNSIFTLYIAELSLGKLCVMLHSCRR